MVFSKFFFLHLTSCFVITPLLEIVFSQFPTQYKPVREIQNRGSAFSKEHLIYCLKNATEIYF